MTDQDRLAEIRQRLAAIDDGEQVIDSAAREFLNHAPADVNWLIYECERLREEVAALRKALDDKPLDTA